MDMSELIDHFMILNDNGESLDINSEYFRAGFELLVAASPYGVEHDERQMIVAALLYSHPQWFDSNINPLDRI